MLERTIPIFKSYFSSGKTVMFSIHQPSSEVFALFDKLIVMSEGKTAYFGAACSMTTYFDAQGYSFPKFSNPIDHLGLMINKDFKGAEAVDQILDNFAESSDREALVKEVEDFEPYEKDEELESAKVSAMSRASFPVQLFYLTRRYFWYYLINPKMFPSLIISNLFSCLLFWGLASGYDGKKDIPDFVLMVLMFLVSTTVPSQAIGGALQLFQAMRPTFLRERSNGLIDCIPYWLSLSLVAFPFLVISAFMIAFFFYWTLDWNNVIWLGILLSGAIVVSDSLWRLVSLFLTDETVMLGCCTCLYIVQLLACGFLVKKSNLKFPYSYAYHVSIFRYAFGGLIVNEFRDRDANANGTTVIEDYELEDESRMDDIMFLGIFYGSFEFLNLLFLFLLHNGKQ